jgi:hypothetical protein
MLGLAVYQPVKTSGLMEIRPKYFTPCKPVKPINALVDPDVIDSLEIGLSAHPSPAIHEGEDELSRESHCSHVFDFSHRIGEFAAS